ncbi:hypothetical protein CA13_51750 [Planctomycetes bacterium CA13]|uniref:Uncharacterized protein n=1 Tax=Novipirellula herctigrandis TaxID=2527986 RepID=A0A5C5Z907_9BACT|nr:hypothetical protein CA13_51750 [Planctomycetes bacterium CA13]
MDLRNTHRQTGHRQTGHRQTGHRQTGHRYAGRRYAGRRYAGRRQSARRKRGSLLVEAAISAVLLVTATVALLKFAKAMKVLNEQANGRLAVTLAAQNAIGRLQALPFALIDSSSDEISKAISETCQCDVDVKTELFESNQRTGVHFVVRAKQSDSVSVTLHDWRFETTGDDDE